MFERECDFEDVLLQADEPPASPLLTPSFNPLLPPLGPLGCGSAVEEAAEAVANGREATYFTDLILNTEEDDVSVRGNGGAFCPASCGGVLT